MSRAGEDGSLDCSNLENQNTPILIQKVETDDMEASMEFITINKEKVPLEGVDPQTPLLWFLRDHLGLTGTKFGCGMALCGASTAPGGQCGAVVRVAGKRRGGARGYHH